MVHPHAQGKHQSLTSTPTAFFGPSPRTGKTHNNWGNYKIWQRSIPTHRGNTLEGFVSDNNLTVHPYAQGKHDMRKMKRIYPNSPSPRTGETPLHDL